MSHPPTPSQSRPPLKDFARSKERFRAGASSSEPPAHRPTTTGSFRYTPESVKKNSRPPVARAWAFASSAGPRLALYVSGLGIGLWGASHIPGVLSMRGSQFALVNHVLLVFTGSFLVFLASHERAVERGNRVLRESEDRVGA